MYTNKQLSKALAEVVAEKGADHRYDIDRNTPHKIEAQVEYSYDDCIVGCVIRKVDPVLLSVILEHELENQETFSFKEGYAPEWVMKNFTDQQINALQAAQSAQDSQKVFGLAKDRFEEVINA